MKRREFVVKSSLASAALGTSSVALGKVFDKSPNETLRIGIIGTGDRGGGLIPLINQIENFEVTACCDILPFRLDKALNISAY